MRILLPRLEGDGREEVVLAEDDVRTVLPRYFDRAGNSDDGRGIDA